MCLHKYTFKNGKQNGHSRTCTCTHKLHTQIHVPFDLEERQRLLPLLRSRTVFVSRTILSPMQWLHECCPAWMMYMQSASTGHPPHTWQYNTKKAELNAYRNIRGRWKKLHQQPQKKERGRKPRCIALCEVCLRPRARPPPQRSSKAAASFSLQNEGRRLCWTSLYNFLGTKKLIDRVDRTGRTYSLI